MKRVLITATPPTPNGDLHLGHLSGPYLAADIYHRYLRLRAVESYYITGADDHQSYVAFKGGQVDWDAAQTADHYGQAMRETLRAARIEVDHYAYPRRSPYHIELVREFFRKLYAEGKIVARTGPALYCEKCERYLFEAYVRGNCPHCGAGSGGNACEDCGRPNDCIDLREPVCKLCGERPGAREFTRLYFPLSPYQSQLRAYYETARMNPHMRALCERMLADGLPDISVSHIAEWGINVPVAGFEEQRIYVWFEMAPGFLAATQELNDRLGSTTGWENFWQADDAEVVQFFGFDNGYFFAVLFPAIYTAYDPQIHLPATFVTNEFYRLDGLKFSTSRNHAIWGRELLAQAPADTVRFYLSYSGPEAEQTNFTLSEYSETVQRELVKGWQGWLSELGRKALAENGGTAPAATGLTEEHARFQRRLAGLAAEMAVAYEPRTFSPQQAARTLCDLVRVARRFGKVEEQWAAAPARQPERSAALALELTAAKTLALLAAPMMPDFAERLWLNLGYEGSLYEHAWEENPTPLPQGFKLSRLDDEYFK